MKRAYWTGIVGVAAQLPQLSVDATQLARALLRTRRPTIRTNNLSTTNNACEPGLLLTYDQLSIENVTGKSALKAGQLGERLFDGVHVGLSRTLHVFTLPSVRCDKICKLLFGALPRR